MSRHAASRDCIIKRKDGIRRAARFKRADFLKIFAFKEQRCSARPIQARASQHRRPMDVRPNPLMGRMDAVEIEGHG
jgi:hypothetical protein